jgi:hypothetical protein
VVGEDAVGFGAEGSEVKSEAKNSIFLQKRQRRARHSDNNFSKHISIVAMLLLHIFLRLYIAINPMPA